MFLLVKKVSYRIQLKDQLQFQDTGGGSTSIRIGSESKYARVIAAGEGGGASGECKYVSPGGFGGGNCYYGESLRSTGAGTQTGSTNSIGASDGDKGSFGLGSSKQVQLRKSFRWRRWLVWRRQWRKW